jgi:basic amino acid/polyamine antiporter, APA family
MSVMRTKSVEQSIRDTDEPDHKLKKNLGALDLVVFGVGVIIGAGIFILTGTAAASYAGPAVALSFLFAGTACALAALCYAEFASTVPVAGSAYTFSYATFGELIAWTIGWDLVLEFTIGASALAVGFSAYLNSLLDGTAFELPAAVQSVSTDSNPDGVFDLSAVVIALVVTGVLIGGIKLSSVFNQIVVAIKLTVVAIVVIGGLGYVSADNYDPFIPASEGSAGESASWLHVPLIQTLFGIEHSVYGWLGVFSGAAIVFFAFIGFDIVATAAEETRNPARDVPRGILGSLAICTALYVAVSLVVVGMQDYTELSATAPLAGAFSANGMPVFSSIISLGALAGLTSVVMILMLGQSRVLFAMSRDHLLPPGLAKVHPRYGTPYRITIATGIVVALLAGFIPLTALAELVNIGTLFAFFLVSIGVWWLRRTRPDLHRSFKVPFINVLPWVSAAASLWLMSNLPTDTWLRFLVWMALGIGMYYVYGRSHSRMATGERLSAADNIARR